MTCPDFHKTTTAELLQLVKLTDDRANLWCFCQRAVWSEIARRGGVK
jgi:hypothetical protein